LQTLADKSEPTSQLPPAKANKKAGNNAPTTFDLRGELYRISGADLTQIDGINIMNAQTIIAEGVLAQREMEKGRSPLV